MRDSGIFAWIYFSKWHKSKDLDTILLLADFGHVRAVTLRGQLHYSQRFCLDWNKTLLAEMVLVKARPQFQFRFLRAKDGKRCWCHLIHFETSGELR